MCPDAVGELLDVLAQFHEGAENSGRDPAIRGDGHVQGDGPAFGVEVIHPVSQRRQVEPGLLTCPPAIADGQEQVPDHPFGRGKIQRSQEFAQPLLGSLVEAVVLARGEGLVRTEPAVGAEGEDGGGAGVEGQLGVGIAGADRGDPGVDVVLLLQQVLIGVLHLHLVAVEPPAGDQLAVAL